MAGRPPRKRRVARSWKGFIKWAREWSDWDLVQDHKAFAVFCVLMGKAAYEPFKHHSGEQLHAGDVLISTRQFAEHMGLTRKQLRGALERLEKRGEIRRRRVGQNGQVISLCYWSVTQQFRPARSGQDSKPVRPTPENRAKPAKRGPDIVSPPPADRQSIGDEDATRAQILAELADHARRAAN